MTGVSYVIPFVAAGGLLIALGFALGGYQVSDAPDIVSVGDDGVVTSAFNAASLGSWAALSFQIGPLAFSLLVPVLAGFIAYAIADRPALVPGFVGGLIAVQTQAGFLGGLVAGLLAGALIYWLKQFQVPRALAGIMPVRGDARWSARRSSGRSCSWWSASRWPRRTTGLTSWLNGLSGTNAVLLGALLGLMMAFDMGGPVNKAAYAFAVAGLSTGSGDRTADHGRGHGRRHDAAAGDGAGLDRPQEAVHRGGARERQGGLAARRSRSSPRARSRSRRPTRCGSSRR